MGTVYRDAGTGEYVTEEYAKANPGTTVSETEAVPPATVTDGSQEETTMSDQPNQDLPQEQGAKGRDNAAQKQAEADARKAAREADKQPHPDNTLPDQQ